MPIEIKDGDVNPFSRDDVPGVREPDVADALTSQDERLVEIISANANRVNAELG